MFHCILDCGLHYIRVPFLSNTYRLLESDEDFPQDRRRYLKKKKQPMVREVNYSSSLSKPTKFCSLSLERFSSTAVMLGAWISLPAAFFRAQKIPRALLSEHINLVCDYYKYAMKK